MKKIVFHLNCLEQGGTERVVTNLANQFALKGYETIVATQRQGKNEFKLNKKIKRVHVGLKETDEKKGSAWKALLRIIYLRSFLKKEKPDIVLAFAKEANYRALLSTIGMRMPVIISIRTAPVGNYDSRMDKLCIPLLFSRAAGCVFQTEEQRKFFPKYLHRKSRIILNPISDKFLNAQKPAQREKAVVQSGRLAGFKNQSMLIDAFLKVHEKHPDYVLKIYGSDSFDGTKELLEQKISACSGEAFIQLMGVSNCLEQELSDASVYAFSSDWEGLPNALLEAMALGLPIAATDCPCGGPRSVITHEVNGLLVPAGDPDALSEGICRLIEDRELAERLGENAARIGEIAGERVIAALWHNYIETVIREYDKKFDW